MKIQTIILSGTVILPLIYANGADRYWSATENALWNEGANWQGGAAPGGSDTFYINNGGTAIISSGVTVNTGSTGYVGQNEGDSGNVIVGGTWNAPTNSYLGYSGSANITINDGGVFRGLAQVYLAYNEGSSAEITVNGTGKFNQDTQLHIGYAGSATVTMNGNSTATTANYARIGSQTGSTGEVYLNDYAEWTVKAQLHVGNSGTGTLIAANNSKIFTTGASTRVGESAGSVGTFVLKDDASLTNSGLVYIGNGGKGNVTLQDRASITTERTWIGTGGGTGVLNVKGNATYTGGYMTVQGTSSTITVEGSGAIYGTATGNNTGIAGYSVVTVKDDGKWINSHATNLTASTFNVEGNGLVSSTTSMVNTGSTLSVGGTGRWENSGALSVGTSGAGELILEGSGTVKAASIAIGGNLATSSGSIVIRGDNIKIVGADGSTPLTIAGTSTGTGTGSIKFQHAGNLAFSNLITGSYVSMEHSGSGTTTIDAANTYRAGTSITGGTVVAANTKALGNGLVTVSGGKLKTSVASLTLNHLSMSSGSVSLIDDIAETINTGNFTMTGGTLELDILSLDTFDKLASAGGTITLSDGILMLKGYDGFEGDLEGEGNKYKIFDGFKTNSGHSLSIKGYNERYWQADIDADGYLYFINMIPEPSTYTAVLGVFALAAVLMRRGK